MSGRPVRLAVASRDQTVAQGLQQLLAAHAHRVVVLAEHDDDGVADVLLHDGELIEAVSQPGVRGLDVERIVALIEVAAGAPSTASDTLTAREREVLALIGEGLTNQQIADRIYVSINSVKTYIRAAYRKIGVTSRTQAVVWGLRNGVDASDRAGQRRSE